MRCVLGLLVLTIAAAADAAAASPGAPAAVPDAPAAAGPAPAAASPELAQALHELVQTGSASLPGGVTLQAALAEIAPVPAEAPLPPGAPRPDVVAPAPVPAERSAEPARDVPRIRIAPPAFTPMTTQPPDIGDEAEASPELIQWRDQLVGKAERRIERNAEIGGLAAVGIRLGGRGQVGDIEGAGDELRQALQSWNDEGALVISVVPGSPAEQAGLMPGDVVVQFAGIWIDSPSLLIRIASRAVVEREQEIWVWRQGEIERLWITPIDRQELGRR